MYKCLRRTHTKSEFKTVRLKGAFGELNPLCKHDEIVLQVLPISDEYAIIELINKHNYYYEGGDGQ